jgi:hypothetical protein
VSSGATPYGGDPAFELLTLLGEEFAAGGIDCGVIAAEGTIPAQLMVELSGDSGNSTVHVCFLPQLVDPPVLQYLVAFAYDLAPGAEADTARFLHVVNSALPLTGFEMSELAAAVVFRYIQPVSVHPLDPAVIAWPLSVIHYAVTHYGPLIEAACTGTAFDDVAATFAQLQNDLLDEI